MWARLRRHFFVGVFTIAPFALTIYLLVLFAGWFDSLFQPAIRVITRPYFDEAIPGLGIIIGLLVIVSVGMMAPSFLGKQVMRMTEVVVAKIPLAKVIYSATKQIMDAFSQTSSQRFSRVVAVPYPRAESYVIGFVTRETQVGWVPGLPHTKLAVFVPTVPNPTSGFMIFYDSAEAVPLDISVEEGLKLVISAGLATPQYILQAEKKLQSSKN